MINSKIKPLTFLQKSMLSVFPLFGTLFFLGSFFYDVISYESYTLIWWVLLILMIFQMVLIFIRIKKIRIDKSLSLIFSILILTVIIFQLYYVWILDDKHVKKIASVDITN
jgi:hypothetical protein